ncbi:MAG TPA: zinc-dependent metalloprotease family protein, partial [Flavobacteriaceae bacterium]|nr:zinc-dependent metalloprotease family protein [Flavobacteriaceae bacterium]
MNSKKEVTNKSKLLPNNYGMFSLDLAKLKQEIALAIQGNLKNKKPLTKIQLPLPDGSLEVFEIEEASIFEAQLQQKFKTIKTYSGKGITNSEAVVKISISKNMFYAMVLQLGKPTLFIDPYTVENSTYISYVKTELQAFQHFKCLVEEQQVEANKTPKTASLIEGPNDGFLRQYRLAVACTGEYAQFQLAQQGISATASEAEKKEAILAAINATMTRVNAIFQRDLAIEMLLVANNTDVIFLDPNTDPFTNNNSNLLIDESQATIDSNIGPVNYDIGHTFSTGGGGLAELSSVCTSNKARGITGSSYPLGDAYNIDFVAHEMGHQFGAHHTFNGDDGNCSGNRNENTAVEPGSGSTIMSYAGLCASQNLQPLVDSYFHGISIDEIWQNITIGNSTCGNLVATTNNTPTANAGQNYTIPISTPFILKGEGNDVDADALTYCWEQIDNELYQFPLESTETGGAVFRSYPPKISPN